MDSFGDYKRMMTPETIHQRLELLRAERDRMVADLNAIDGAIQDCEYWFNEVSKDAKEETDTQTAGDTGGDAAGPNPA